ncbi:MAG: glycosyltransferase family 2 protein [Paludibacteraceae bacterium]|nr:glycosyltransferase family 2 protein [Paludibacteraceae bacterium]
MTNKTPLVSICIPVYNAMPYLEKCCVALFEQTYPFIEYVFVNDCSTDDSLSVLNSVIERYPHRKSSVKVISHERNCGVSVARNTALDSVSGTFLMWVDADDRLDISTVEKIVKLQAQTGCDMLTFDSVYMLPDNNMQFRNADASTKTEFVRSLFDRKTNFSLWGRLLKTSIIKEQNIRFVEGRNAGEDLLFILKYAVLCRSFANLHENLYLYNKQNSGALTNMFSKEKSEQLSENMEDCKSVLINSQLYEDCASAYNRRIVKMYSRMLLGTAKMNSDRDFFFYIQCKGNEKTLKESMSSVPLLYRVLFFFKSFTLAHYYVVLLSEIKRILVKFKIQNNSYRM